MNKNSKLAAIALMVALGVVMPTYAQAMETGTAANREQLYGYGPSRSGFSAYAAVPKASSRHGGYMWRHYWGY